MKGIKSKKGGAKIESSLNNYWAEHLKKQNTTNIVLLSVGPPRYFRNGIIENQKIAKVDDWPANSRSTTKKEGQLRVFGNWTPIINTNNVTGYMEFTDYVNEGQQQLYNSSVMVQDEVTNWEDIFDHEGKVNVDIESGPVLQKLEPDYSFLLYFRTSSCLFHFT